MSNFPPDGYVIGVGTWNTDAQENTTTFVSGSSSVEFVQGTTATSLVAREYAPVPVSRERNWHVHALVQGYGAITGSVDVGAFFYDQSKTYVRTSVATYPIAVAGVWYDVGTLLQVQAGEYYVRPMIRKDAVNQGYYIDRLWCAPVPGAAWVTQAIGWSQVIPSAAGWTTITPWGALATGSTGFTYTSPNIIPMYSGIANAHTTICWDQATAAIGDVYEVRINWIDSISLGNEYMYADTTPLASVPPAGIPVRQTVSGYINVQSSLGINVQVRQQTGGNRNVICGASSAANDWSSFRVAMMH